MRRSVGIVRLRIKGIKAKDKLATLSDTGTTLSKTEIKYYVDKADKYYKEKNFQEALKNYLIAANAGDDYAQNWVGWMYKNAEGWSKIIWKHTSGI